MLSKILFIWIILCSTCYADYTVSRSITQEYHGTIEDLYIDLAIQTIPKIPTILKNKQPLKNRIFTGTELNILLEDKHHYFNVGLHGNILSRWDFPRVYTSINYLKIEADLQQNDTTIVTITCSVLVHQSYNSRCRLIRRISARRGRRITERRISNYIDSRLLKISECLNNLE